MRSEYRGGDSGGCRDDWTTLPRYIHMQIQCNILVERKATFFLQWWLIFQEVFIEHFIQWLCLHFKEPNGQRWDCILYYYTLKVHVLNDYTGVHFKGSGADTLWPIRANKVSTSSSFPNVFVWVQLDWLCKWFCTKLRKYGFVDHHVLFNRNWERLHYSNVQNVLLKWRKKIAGEITGVIKLLMD